MPNADRECNSPRAIRCHADDPISVTIGANRSETTPKRGCRPFCLRREPKIRPPARCGAIRAVFRTSCRQRPLSIAPRAAIAIEVPCDGFLAASTSQGVPGPPGLRRPDDACRLNFAAKPPSSG